MSPNPFLETGSLEEDYATVDWTATGLGPVTEWSPAVRGAVDLALHTRFPVAIFLGPDLVMLYNEAYVRLIDDKHPQALGAKARDIFPEVWDVIGPMFRAVMEGEGPNWFTDSYVPLHRSGYLEECYFTFSYSPIHGPGNVVEGVVDIATETTAQVIAGRRLRMLSHLTDELAEAQSHEDVLSRALVAMAEDEADLPEVEFRMAGAAPAPYSTFPDAPAVPASALRAADPVLEDTPRGRMAWVPLSDKGTLLVRMSPYLAPDAAYLDFLRLIAAGIDQTLDRVVSLEAERSLSAALQLSLLTRPPTVPECQVAVRYQPAAELAQVGGDWYDAFLQPDKSLMLVVGDVAGHDQIAAASMGQLRSLVRGVAHTGQGSPAEVLSGLDRAMDGLEVGVVATAVLAQVRTDTTSGHLDVAWSNAGHPPPLLLRPDGSVELVEVAPDLLLGLEPAMARHDHRLVLEPGATLLFYSDGLVERRGQALDDRLDWLLDVVRDQQHLAPEDLCDHLLDLLPAEPEDDVALLAARCPPTTPAPSAPAAPRAGG